MLRNERTLSAITALAAILSVPCAASAQMVLLDFETDLKAEQTGFRDATATIVEEDGDRALRLDLGDSDKYPSVRLSPVGGKRWDLTRYEKVELDVVNLDDVSVRLFVKVESPGGKDHWCTGSVTLDPHSKDTLVVPLNRAIKPELVSQLTGMVAYPTGMTSRTGTVDPAEITKITVFVQNPSQKHRVTIDDLRATGDFDAEAVAASLPEPFFPFIDTFGQYRHREWPGKLHDEDELQRRITAEQTDLAENPGPSTWNRFGGWADGPTLEATGHFYTTQHEGRWWLVDPEGKLFFLIGVAAVQPRAETIIDGRETWFSDRPWERPEFAEFVGSTPPNRAGKTTRYFNYYQANLKRKYGESWQTRFLDLTHERLRSWGFNTLGCWSMPELLPMARTPYTHWIYYQAKNLPRGPGAKKPFPDVFDAAFENELRRRAVDMIGSTVNDPYCIGYYVDNELSWGNESTLARGVLKGDAQSAAKKALIEDLKAKYQTIEALNQAWGVQATSWDGFLADEHEPTAPAGENDLRDFNERILRVYFETVQQVLRDVAPNKLYLGCRFSDYNEQVVRIAAEYCDVVSFNLYRQSVAGYTPPVKIDKPIVIGEFHFGSGKDRGLFGGGLVAVDNQAERAEAYRRYVTGALQHPQILGVNWFCFVDEPASGRRLVDAENYQIGLVDVVDSPYDETIEATRAVAAEMYTIRAAGGR